MIQRQIQRQGNYFSASLSHNETVLWFCTIIHYLHSLSVCHTSDLLVNATPSLPPGLSLLVMLFHHMGPLNHIKAAAIIRRYIYGLTFFLVLKFKAWPWSDWIGFNEMDERDEVDFTASLLK